MWSNGLFMKKVLLLFLLLSVCTACNRGTSYPEPSQDYMVLDQIEYVNEFPVNLNLPDEGLDTGLDIIGIQNFQVIDSLLLICQSSSQGFWRFYSLNDHKLLGKMLSIGQGPNEFRYPVSSGNYYTMEEENGNLFAMILDQYKGGVYRLNITESLESGQVNMEFFPKGFTSSIVYACAIDDEAFLCREIAEDGRHQNLYVMKNGEKSIPDVLEKLNRATVDAENDGFTFNMVSALIRRKRNLFVEVPLYLNYINLFSLDGKTSKTLCVEDELMKISSVTDKSEPLRKSTYTAIKAFNDFFGAAFYNHTWMERDLGIKKSSQIQLFDWNGKPLAAINVNRIVTSFDIDFTRGELYLFSSSDDEFVKYDISDLLKQLKK